MKKEVCQACWRERRWPWTFFQDTSWEKGLINYCACQKHNGCLWFRLPGDSVDSRPPRGCSYTLEHIVLNQSLPEMDEVEWIDSMDQKGDCS